MKTLLNSQKFRAGGYSFLLIGVVFLILLVVNILMYILPSNLTQLDFSSNRLYSISSETKVVLNNLEDDVTIYWICQAGEEDSVMEKILDKYEAQSSHINVVKKNPDVYPTFADNYTDSDPSNNDLVVESGSKYRYISINDVYEYDEELYMYYGEYDADFDGEGEITSAVKYVVSDDLPKLYVLNGHGEADLSEEFSDCLTQQNIETGDLNLVSEGAVPEDADGLIICAPETDLSQEEVSIIETYIQNGGKLFVMAGPSQEGDLENLSALAAYCGLIYQKGIVMEGDTSAYAFESQYVIIPQTGESDLTESITGDNKNIIVPIAGGMTLSDETPSGIEVTQVLTTTDSAYSKVAGYEINTYEKEDGDIDGPFILAATVTDSSAGCDGQVVWISSSYFMDSTYNSYSSDANLTFTVNAFSWLMGESESTVVPSKSLDYEYLTISDAQASVLKFIFLALAPLVLVVAGIYELITRRRMR